MHLKLLFSLFFILIPFNAFAYLGPGLGIGIITTAFGIILAILIAIIGIIYFPIKKLFSKKKKKNEPPI